MSCSGAFDINENGKYDPCDKSICPFDYDYEYDNSTLCKVTKKSNYLKLECTTSSSTATVGQVKDMGVLEVRLYCPSVNRWGGKKADAELIIRHSGQGKNGYVCVPITKVAGSATGNGVEFFERLDSAVKVLGGGTNMQTVNLGANWSLNKLIPKSPYYYAEKDGLAFDSACNYDTNSVLIFPLGSAINVKQVHLTNINNAVSTGYNGNRRPINSSADELVQGSGAGQFFYNDEGTKGDTGGGPDAGLPVGMTCTPVLDEATGENVVADPREKMGWIQSKMKNINVKELLKYLMYTAIAFVTLIVIYYFYLYCIKKTVDHPDKPGKMTSKFSRWLVMRAKGKAGGGGEE
tara:strand:- start:2905 stop:3951 length:1047 start_codon:yes stop_codon:yes gene_type:complete